MGTNTWKSLGRFSGSSLSTHKIFEDIGRIKVIYDISEKGKIKLDWLDYYNDHNKNARLTCRRFGISSRTFYKAKNRFEQHRYRGLNDLSRKPHNFRKSKIPLAIISDILKLREEHPTWSKYKIGAILRKKNNIISDSSIGRILSNKGKIDDNISKKKKRIYKRSRRRVRIDNEIFVLKNPGDLIQMDTKYYTHPWGETVYQFTAIDCVTRLRILRLYKTKVAANGKEFLKEVIRLFPFKVKRIQSDNGSEFLGDFRRECLNLNIKHLFSYPNSPQQNAFVESSHSTDEREFYLIKEMPIDLDEFRKMLSDWENCYNYERPHGSINFLTPWEYYKSLCSLN